MEHSVGTALVRRSSNLGSWLVVVGNCSVCHTHWSDEVRRNGIKACLEAGEAWKLKHQRSCFSEVRADVTAAAQLEVALAKVYQLEQDLRFMTEDRDGANRAKDEVLQNLRNIIEG